MTSCTVPVNPLSEPYNGMYGAALNARFTPLRWPGDGTAPGKLVLETADRESERATSQYFTVDYDFNGHREQRVVKRFFVPSAENGELPMEEKGQAAVAFHELYVNAKRPREPVLTAHRVERHKDSQTIKVTDDDGQHNLLRKGFRVATVQDVLDAITRGKSGRAESERVRKANSLSARDSNLATIMASAIGAAVKESQTQMMTLFMGILEAAGLKVKQPELPPVKVEIPDGKKKG